MWHQESLTRSRQGRRFGKAISGRAALGAALLVALALLAGCGASAGSASSVQAPSGIDHSVSSGASAGAPATSGSSSATSGSSGKSSSQPMAQYLIKSLNVSMTAPDTRAAAADLQSWITSTDPKAQSAGVNYVVDSDQYDISLTFNVQASLYPQIESYLASYASQHKGKLISLEETVQDVTNDYVDSQSRLTNLRGEQARLQTLMSQAQSLGDVLTIEQRLTDVEGQIEQIEAHLNELSGQTSFYTIQIRLTPVSTYMPPVAQPWSPAAIFHDALTSALAFGEGLLTLFIWLAVYAIYIVPVGVIIWLVVRYTRRRSAALAVSATRPSGSGAPPTA